MRQLVAGEMLHQPQQVAKWDASTRFQYPELLACLVAGHLRDERRHSRRIRIAGERDTVVVLERLPGHGDSFPMVGCDRTSACRWAHSSRLGGACGRFGVIS